MEIYEWYWPFGTLYPGNPIALMLRARIVTTEGALEMEIDSLFVNIYNLDIVDQIIETGYVRFTLKKMRIDSHDYLSHSAAIATNVLGVRRHRCGYISSGSARHHSEQLILSVEYTCQSMSASVWMEEYGIQRQRDRMHSVQTRLRRVWECEKL